MTVSDPAFSDEWAVGKSVRVTVEWLRSPGRLVADPVPTGRPPDEYEFSLLEWETSRLLVLLLNKVTLPGVDGATGLV